MQELLRAAFRARRGRVHEQPARAARRPRRARRAEQPRCARRAARAGRGRRGDPHRRDRVHPPLVPLRLRRRRPRTDPRYGRSGRACPSTSTRSHRSTRARPAVGSAAWSSRVRRMQTGSRSIRCWLRTGRARTSRSRNTFLFDEMASFRRALTAPDAERRRLLASPETRDAMRKDIATGGTSFVFFWPVIRCESVARPENEQYVGKSVTEIAAMMGEGRDRARRVPRPLARRRPRDPVRAGRAARPAPARRDRAAHPRTARDGRELRRWRAPAQLLRRRLHHPPAHRMGRRAHLRGCGGASHVHTGARDKASATGACCARARRPTSC